MFPEITGSCSTCTIYLQLSTSDDTVITLSDVGPFEYDADDTEELVTTISVDEDTLSSNHTITMSTYGERDGAEYTLLLEESFTVSIENIEAVIEEVIVVEEVIEEVVEEVVVEEDFQIDIDAILAEFLEQPYLEPELEAEYFFEVGVPIFVDLGLPVDPQGGILELGIQFGAAEFLLEQVDSFIQQKQGTNSTTVDDIG